MMSTTDDQAPSCHFLPMSNAGEDPARRALWESLSLQTKALLSTDGSVTLLLGAFAGEDIDVSVLDQQTCSEGSCLALRPGKHEQALKRTVLLRTATSRKNLAYAQACIAHERLDIALQRMLIDGNVPLGLVLRQGRVESFRALVDWGGCKMEDVPHLSAYLHCDELVHRTYHIVVDRTPLVRVTEYFPAQLFNGR